MSNPDSRIIKHMYTQPCIINSKVEQKRGLIVQIQSVTKAFGMNIYTLRPRSLVHRPLIAQRAHIALDV
jgi:hypothetical protein